MKKTLIAASALFTLVSFAAFAQDATTTMAPGTSPVTTTTITPGTVTTVTTPTVGGTVAVPTSPAVTTTTTTTAPAGSVTGQ